MSYSIVKNGRHWGVLKDGAPVVDEQYNVRKRDAEAAITRLQAYDEWLTKLLEEDRTGVYQWSEDDEKQINDYANILKVNEERWTFCGKFPAQKIARDRHKKDAEILLTDCSRWIDPERMFAETRRMMAARIEAFKRAGVEL